MRNWVAGLSFVANQVQEARLRYVAPPISDANRRSEAPLEDRQAHQEAKERGEHRHHREQVGGSKIRFVYTIRDGSVWIITVEEGS